MDPADVEVIIEVDTLHDIVVPRTKLSKGERVIVTRERAQLWAANRFCRLVTADDGPLEAATAASTPRRR